MMCSRGTTPKPPRQLQPPHKHQALLHRTSYTTTLFDTSPPPHLPRTPIPWSKCMREAVAATMMMVYSPPAWAAWVFEILVENNYDGNSYLKTPKTFKSLPSQPSQPLMFCKPLSPFCFYQHRLRFILVYNEHMLIEFYVSREK